MNRSESKDYLPFLDYPHAHDTTKVAHVAALPTDLLRQLPNGIQDALWLLQESTSVLYASFDRLHDLLSQRYERLSLVPGSYFYSEEGFFNYVNQISAERQYLLQDAYPDWKHKLSNVKLNEHLDLAITFQGRKTTVREWFSQLQVTVVNWSQEARATEIPDFQETVSEYTSQSKTPTSVISCDSL